MFREGMSWIFRKDKQKNLRMTQLCWRDLKQEKKKESKDKILTEHSTT